MTPETQFTTRCAVERGIQIAKSQAPHFAQHIQETRAQMELAAEETAKKGFPVTAEAMRRYAHEL